MESGDGIDTEFQLVYVPIQMIASALDQPLDNVIYFATVIGSFVACLTLGQIENVPLRKGFSISMGLCIGFFIYGRLFAWNVGFVLVNYAFMRCFPRALAANLMVGFSVCCLLGSGYYAKYIRNKYSLDIDLAIMINFCKLHMFAVNYDNAAMLADPARSKLFTTRERHYAETLRKRVRLVDFANYFLFCASCFSGMVHEYRDFDEFIHRTGQYSAIPKDRLLKPALQRFVSVIFCAALLVIMTLSFPKPYLMTDEFTNEPFWYRCFFMMGVALIKFVTLVLGFSAMECNFIACG